MDFEWDTAKERANRKKHGIDFRTAAKVFLDPYVIEFDDHGAAGERRFNAIGLVDGRMLFVAYALRLIGYALREVGNERDVRAVAATAWFACQRLEALQQKWQDLFKATARAAS